MLLLIDRKVNLESRTRNAKQNTACTLASAQGGGTMYEILVAAGGDINATTADGVGQRQAARQSSSSVHARTIAAHVPDTNSHRAGARCQYHSTPLRGCFDKGFIIAGKRAIYGLDHTALDDHSLVSHRVSQRIERTALAHSLVGVGDHSI